MHKILLIEDERKIARFIELELHCELYSITIAHGKLSGLSLALQQEWDLILLDLMNPGEEGIKLCRQIRKSKQTPIITIASRNNLEEKISLLDSGADDYIPRPFALEELLARMRSLLRRVGALNNSSLLIVRDIALDIDGRLLKKNNHPIELTKREFEILLVLMKNMGRVLTREMLLESIWGYDSDVDVKVVDVYISYLRSKIDVSGQPSIIQTMRGLGYVIRK
jgi:DNA-binding response OmpR family regulator